MFGGLAGGAAASGIMDSVPLKSAATPVADGAPHGKQANGSVVTAGGELSGRQTLYISIGYVIIAALILGIGARIFHNAKVG
jgi:hypothetical protein